MKTMGLATTRNSAPDNWERRTDLAAAFHLAVHFNWHESVGNHFSAAISDDGRRFLMNRKWVHFSEVTASTLQELDSEDASVMDGDDAPDASAWTIHGNLHASLPQARVVLHCHPPYATAVSCLKDPSIPPIDQNTARFYERVAIDTAFGGIADDAAEGERLVRALGNKSVMMMGNHGVLVIGRTVAQAFEEMYFLERACRTLVLARSNGQPMNVMPDEIARKTMAGWRAYEGMAFAHFDHLKRGLRRAGSVFDS